MTRLLSIGLRGGSMFGQAACGFLVSTRGTADDIEAFFSVIAVVPILVLLLGAELHVVTDRLIARGTPAMDALGWLFKRQTPFLALILVGAVIVLVTGKAGTITTISTVVIAVTGWLGQETFRALVASGRAVHASIVFLVRNGLAFFAGAGMALFGVVDVTWLLSLWGSFSAISVPLGLILLRRDSSYTEALKITRYAGAVWSYLPSTVVARIMLSGDLFVVAHLPADPHIALYGNANSLLLGFFALSDVGILQWRAKQIYGQSTEAIRHTRRDYTLLAAPTAGSVFALLPIFGSGSRMESLTVAILLAIAGAFLILASGQHAVTYAMNRDRHIRRAYLSASLPFSALLGLGVVSTSAVPCAAAKAVGWLAVFLILAHGNRKGRP